MKDAHALSVGSLRLQFRESNGIYVRGRMGRWQPGAMESMEAEEDATRQLQCVLNMKRMHLMY